MDVSVDSVPNVYMDTVYALLSNIIVYYYRAVLTGRLKCLP